MISNLGKHAYWGQAIEGYRLIEHQVTCSVFCADGALFTWTIDLKTPNPFPTSKTCIYHKYCGRINLEIWILPSNQSILFQFNIGENETAEILALKNEPGPISTLCRKDAAGNWVLNDRPDPTLELVKCQRYFREFCEYGLCEAKSNSEVEIDIITPLDMRVRPTLIPTYAAAFTLNGWDTTDPQNIQVSGGNDRVTTVLAKGLSGQSKEAFGFGLVKGYWDADL